MNEEQTASLQNGLVEPARWPDVRIPRCEPLSGVHSDPVVCDDSSHVGFAVAGMWEVPSHSNRVVAGPRLRVAAGAAFRTSGGNASRTDMHFDPAVLGFRPAANSHSRLRLDREHRERNVRENLYVRSPESVADRHVVVIDDVVTTGATMLYAHGYLMRTGARTVTCFALAKTVRD